jgi:hypothetical protein
MYESVLLFWVTAQVDLDMEQQFVTALLADPEVGPQLAGLGCALINRSDHHHHHHQQQQCGASRVVHLPARLPRRCEVTPVGKAVFGSNLPLHQGMQLYKRWGRGCRAWELEADE